MITFWKKIYRWIIFTLKTHTFSMPIITEVLHKEIVSRKIPALYIEEESSYFAHEFTKQIDPSYEIVCSKALVTWKGHVVINNKAIKETWSGENYILKDNYWNLEIQSIPKETKTCCVFTRWSDNYYHWFGEVIPKLMYLHNKGTLHSYTYFFPDNHKKQYIIDSLEMLNVSYSFFPKGELCLFVPQLYFIGLTAELGNFRPSLHQSIRTFFVNAVLREQQQKSAFRKVYISRKNAEKRFVLNENDLLPILKTFGFEFYEFEHLSLSQQIVLMTETKVLMGIHGAGLTNIHFMQKDTSLIEFRLDGDIHMNLFYSLASALDIHYNYLLCKGTNTIDIHESNIFVEIEKLNVILNRL